MRFAARLFFAFGFLALAGCSDVNGGAQGGGSEYGSGGHVRVGVPF
jgi:hypothetical protein